jgi:hypothetical protein
MTRTVIGKLKVWDVAAGAGATLEPGGTLCSCEMSRDSAAAGTDPYVMQFLSAGRLYTCPLFRFQPRTQFVRPN